MTFLPDLAPGAPAPVSGAYESLNVLGTSSGTRVTRRRGERMPKAPIGWTWRYAGPASAPEIRPFHRYGSGDRVIYHPTLGVLASAAGPYTVERVLPIDAQGQLYRIRSVRDGHERFASENDLMPGEYAQGRRFPSVGAAHRAGCLARNGRHWQQCRR